MTWIDAVAILLVIGIGWLQSIRGFGRAVFDTVGALIAMKIATFAATPLATAVPLTSSEAGAEACWMAAVFVLLVILIIIATKFIYETTLLSLDVLDPAVGGILGVVCGVITSHIFLRALLIGYAGTDFAKTVMNTFVCQELVQFRTYHLVVTALQNLGQW